MISNILKKLFGDKSAKDQKQYQPAIDASNKFSAEFLSISDDELRGKTAKFKKLIQEGTAELEKELKSLKDKAADISTSIHDKEDLFELIDKKTKEVDEKIEEVLADILPEAFATVKETEEDGLKMEN